MLEIFRRRPPGRLQTRFATVALTGALLAMGAISAPEAATVDPFFCDRCSHVTDIVVDNNDGTWTYNFTVWNDTTSYGGDQRIRDWELPYFSDAGISAVTITAPGYGGWAWTIETIGIENLATGWTGTAAWQMPGDPFYAGVGSPFTTATQVLHWYTNNFAAAIAPQDSLGGFGFVAKFGPTAAPYQASWIDLPVRTGDPQFPGAGLPNSPSVRGTSVPEPATATLLAFGLLILARVTGRRTPRR